MSKDIEYFLNNYLRSKGNLRAYKQLMLVLKCDLIYHTLNKKMSLELKFNKYEHIQFFRYRSEE